MYEEYLYKSKIETIEGLLENMLIDNDSFEMDSLLESLTELKDLNGKKILKLDDDLHFNKESIEILNKAIEGFKKTLEIFKKDYSDLEVYYDEVKENLNEITEFFKKNTLTKKENSEEPVIFITIPIGDKTSLDYDIAGESVKVEFNGKQTQLNSPHDYEFSLAMPSPINGRKNVDVLLSELETIEARLSSDPCIINHTGAHRPFQSEDGSQVKRNTRACTRIQLNQYGPRIIAIPGIYHKVGQIDNEVQREYNCRKEVLDNLKADKKYSIEECSRLYNKFKLKLITEKYGKNVNETLAMCRYIIAKETKNIER